MQHNDVFRVVGRVVAGEASRLTAYMTRSGPAVEVTPPQGSQSYYLFPDSRYHDRHDQTQVELFGDNRFRVVQSQLTTRQGVSVLKGVFRVRQNAATLAEPPVTDQAVIPAGGDATRLRPLTFRMPKPALEIGQGETLIGRIADQLHDSGIRNLLVTTYVMPDKIKKALDSIQDKFHQLAFFQEPAQAGDFGGLLHALKDPKRYGLDLSKPLLVMNGDAYLENVNFKRFMAVHRKQDADITLLTSPVNEAQVKEFGIVETDRQDEDGQSGLIRRFLEKPQPDQTASRLANTAICLFSPQALKAAMAEAEGMTGKQDKINLFAHVMPRLVEKVQRGDLTREDGSPMRFWAQSLEGVWYDVGHPETYLGLMQSRTKPGPAFWSQTKPHPGVTVTGNIVAASHS
jgi:NDP-sugar pyrophosphorylase family protein